MSDLFSRFPKPEPEIYPDREVALQKQAHVLRYVGKSTGELTRAAKELCLSAARLERFDTLASHLNAISYASQQKVFGSE